VQHDAQELARILLDRVQKRIRARCVQAVGSSGGALDFVASLFQGEMETQLRCLHVDATSTKKEIFFDIQLDVPLEAPSTGAAIAPWSLKSALDKYTAVELVCDMPLLHVGVGRVALSTGFVCFSWTATISISMRSTESKTLKRKFASCRCPLFCRYCVNVFCML